MDQAAGYFKHLGPGSTASVSRCDAMPQPHDPAYNRDNEQKPGRPQRHASEPEGSEGTARSEKTLTDPATGEPDNARGHAPNRAVADQTDGVKRRR